MLEEVEFCRQAGISRVTAWRLRTAGKLGFSRAGRRVLIPESELEAYLTYRRFRGASGARGPRRRK